jgi:hypothetical protein
VESLHVDTEFPGVLVSIPDEQFVVRLQVTVGSVEHVRLVLEWKEVLVLLLGSAVDISHPVGGRGVRRIDASEWMPVFLQLE